MKSVYISGIPTAGKSHLANKIAKTTGAIHVDIDDMREEMRKDLRLKSWVDFFKDKNEKEYWQEVSHEEHWSNLKKQSEAFWIVVKKRINEILATRQPAIFEGVNLLPHLITEIPIKGIVLIGQSEEIVLERNKRDPRWGKTEDLQNTEAKFFFRCERPIYKKEAKKYGIKTLTNPEEAEKELLSLMGYKK